MTFRSRLAIAFTVAAAVPLVLLGLGVRREMTTQLGRQADRGVNARVAQLAAYLAADIRGTRNRLRSHAQVLAEDNRFRLAIGAGGGAGRRWLLDWASAVIRLGGLDLLQLRDEEGRILSSGHFRNEYDRLSPSVPAALADAGEDGALLRVRAPEGDLLVLGTVDSFRVGGRRFTLTGGTVMDSSRIAGLSADEIQVSLVVGDSTTRDAVAELPLRYLDELAGVSGSARLVVTRDRGPLEALLRGVNRWFVAALALTFLFAVGMALWLASLVSRPLAKLADKTSQVDLDRLDQDFATDRGDEIGALARLLDAMTVRLRTSASRLRDAERRATIGDLARQINHDVKNGLAPIRHVLRHFAETAEREPERLAAIFEERRGTIESSVEYLEDLARNYAKLAPALARSPCDARAILSEIARAAGPDVVVEVLPGDLIPPVRADAVVLRRILENLVANAVEALDGNPGRVSLGSEVIRDGGEPRVRISVTDTGRGMTREELNRAFDDFYTTKAAGTGLGLSVVRRLVTDLGGTLRVETTPGQGSTFIVEIPAAGPSGGMNPAPTPAIPERG